jgi:hypothetical protein
MSFGRIVRGLSSILWAFFLLAFSYGSAQAVPIFAHQYGFSCQKCHDVIPRLNDFGEAFFENGYRLPSISKSKDVPLDPTTAAAISATISTEPTSAPTKPFIEPGPSFPFSMKLNLQSTNVPEDGFPRTVVDEVEMIAAGTIGSRLNYFGEEYLIDGGAPGLLREAWMRDQINPFDSRIPLRVQVGQFTLPLPIDVESFRESAAHYAVWDQAVGNNPFTFFDPKAGAMAMIGSRSHGTSAGFLLMNGHDSQSGLPGVGLDRMAAFQHVMGPLTLAFYRYEGRRPDGDLINRFQRTGYGLVYAQGRWESDTVLQTGWDTSMDGLGNGTPSSGGFTQLRYAFSPRVFGLLRIDGTNNAAAGLVRTSTYLIGYRPSRNARLTLENTLSHTPQTHNDVVLQYTTAY